jgi:predicted ATPase/class 3 adenylate cyclase
LFTDVESSTQRWETRNQAMAAAVQRHDAVLRETVAQHNGYIFKMTGDGMASAFDRTSEAAATALEVQRALAREDFTAVDGLRVRMALHTGEAQERDGDYFGPTVNRVARLLAIGHGGQILLTRITAELLESETALGADLRDLGVHRLKDITEPEQVFQLIGADLQTEFPALRSVGALPNNLPLQLTSFVGRQAELNTVASHMEQSRLVTLAGSGGVGKTRLAIQLGNALLDRYPGGVWLVELAPVTDPDLVPSVVASALSLRESQERPVVESIVAALGSKSELLIFDNCEHVIDAVAKLAGAILKACSNVGILATSRQGLGIGGEWIHRVASLPFPKTSRGVNARSAMHYGAIALFVERATAANHKFQLTDENAVDVAKICRRLDGIPLAIELAAAHVNVLNVKHLKTRLDERFRVLTGGNRAALPRHQTMRALIEWSYNLLEESEKTLFRRTAVFAGDYSLDAARAICADEPLNDFDVPELTVSLVEKSLVHAEPNDLLERYRMLESTRDYALEKLTESGEREQIARKHAEFFRALAEDADKGFYTIPQAEWYALLHREVENLRGALLWTLEEERDPELGGALAGSLERFWFEVGQISEGRRWVDRALELLDESVAPQIAARLWLARAVLTEGVESCAAADRACELYERLDDRRGLGYAMRKRGFALRDIGNLPEAEVALRRAAEFLDERSEPGEWAHAMTTLGSIAAFRGDFESARATYQEALDTAQTHGAEFGVMVAYLHLADLEFQSGNFELAIEHAAEALNLAERSKSSRLLANLRNNLASYRLAVGRLAESAADAREALRILQEIQNGYQIAIAVQNLALIAALSDDPQRAALLTGYVDAYFERNGLERQPTEVWGRKRIEESLREPGADLTLSTRRGALLKEEQAIAEALSVRGPKAI